MKKLLIMMMRPFDDDPFYIDSDPFDDYDAFRTEDFEHDVMDDPYESSGEPGL